MIFTILIWIVIAIAVTTILLFFYFLLNDIEECVFTIILGFAVGLFPTAVLIVIWSVHASDISKVLAQGQIIVIQEERVAQLTDRLNTFDYPRGALVNNDSPIASIVSALNDAESSLAKAKHERALAIRNIEARRVGPVSDVIDFVGDYKAE